MYPLRDQNFQLYGFSLVKHSKEYYFGMNICRIHPCILISNMDVFILYMFTAVESYRRELYMTFSDARQGGRRIELPRLWQEVRDWSLITGRGGLQNGKIAGPQLFATPPHDRVKLFEPPLLKSGNFSRLPYNMASTSSYLLKTTPKLFVPPPLQHV